MTFFNFFVVFGSHFRENFAVLISFYKGFVASGNSPPFLLLSAVSDVRPGRIDPGFPAPGSRMTVVCHKLPQTIRFFTRVIFRGVYQPTSQPGSQDGKKYRFGRFMGPKWVQIGPILKVISFQTGILPWRAVQDRFVQHLPFRQKVHQQKIRFLP